MRTRSGSASRSSTAPTQPTTSEKRRLLMRFALSILLLAATAAQANPLRVCATTPDLGAIVRAIGGDDVVVTVFAKGTEDPHFVEAKPSFVKELSTADLLVVGGL